MQGPRAVLVRLHAPLYDLVEDWRRAQPKIPSRSDAVRLLISQALAASSAARTVDEAVRPSTP